MSADSQSPQKTELIGPMRFWFVKHYRRIKQERINQKNYLLKSVDRWSKTIYKYSKSVFVPKKRKTLERLSESHWVFPIKELALDLTFHYN